MDVVVAVGNEIDPVGPGSRPANGRIERFIPAAEILRRCDLVVSHAGSRSVIGALAVGVPQVVLPMGADQPLNADRCRGLGVAVVLDASTASSHALGEAARLVLDDGDYRASASRVREEIRSLPGAADAAERLERLAPAAPDHGR